MKAVINSKVDLGFQMCVSSGSRELGVSHIGVYDGSSHIVGALACKRLLPGHTEQLLLGYEASITVALKLCYAD